MYLAHLKTLARKAMATTFDIDHPVEDMRSIPVELNFPVKENEVPGIWVDFEPIGPLRPVGIGYTEDHYDEQAGGFFQTTRWSFAGNLTYTAVAMSGLHRDRIFDEMVGVIAFGQYDQQRGEFRTTMENDGLIAIQVNFDEVDQRGFAAAPGTPWGTDDMMYEATIALQCQGEFVNQPGSTLLVPLSEIHVYHWVNKLEQDPTLGDGGGPWMQ